MISPEEKGGEKFEEAPEEKIGEKSRRDVPKMNKEVDSRGHSRGSRKTPERH